MNRYHIRINGKEVTESYTYQELKDNGLFELDENNMNGIEVKNTMESDFTPLKSYCFPERKFGKELKYKSAKKTAGSYYIDEFGRIVKRIKRKPDDEPSSNENWKEVGKIILSIIVIVIAVAIYIAFDGKYSVPLVGAVVITLREIWK